MAIDVELYRRDVRVAIQPPLRLSVIDINPEFPVQTLVFIHGFGGSGVQWLYQLAQFSLENRVIAMDLRGHGLSDKPASDYSMAEIQDDLEILLHALGINQPVVLIGHSFGGAIAATFAAKHPERVKRLILIASAVAYKLHPFYRVGLRLPDSILRLAGPLLRKQVDVPGPILKAWYENNLSHWNGQEAYRSVTIPTLVVRGYQDQLFEKPAYDQVSQLVPNSEEIDVGASGHMVMLERKDAVNRAISRFIRTDLPIQSESGLLEEDRQQTQLQKDRPWLAHYDQQVPATVAIPRATVPALLDSSARRFPNRAALVHQGGSLSYKKLQGDANRFGRALLGLGLRKGDRVILALPNLPQWVIAYYGVLLAGGVAVFAQPDAPPEQMVEVIRQSGARVLVTLTEFDTLIQQVRQEFPPGSQPALEHVIFTHITDYLPLKERMQIQLSPEQRMRHLLDIPIDASIHSFRRLLQRQDRSAPNIERSPSDLAVISFTGGTTSQPKGVMLSHRNLIANTLQTRHWLPDAEEGSERLLCIVPLAHSYGLTAGLHIPIAIGATIILEFDFNLDRILEDIARYRPTIFPGVPQIFIKIMNAPNVRKYGLDSIRATISGSEPLPLEVLESYEKLTHGHLIEGYGLTEASPITHVSPIGGKQKPGSIGLPIPSTEARLVDLRRGKKVVAFGQIGELVIRGPQVMLGYWQDPAGTSQVLSPDGWLHTGDVAQMDSDGYFRIIARKDEMWYPNRPDRPASPRAVEEVLHEIPQVKDVAVTVIAGQPVAFVIPGKERPSAEALIAYCKRRLPPELTPRLVIFVDEFPRSFVGKVLRKELAKHIEAKENLAEPGQSPVSNPGGR